MKNPVALLDSPQSYSFIQPENASLKSEDTEFFCPYPNCADPDHRLYLRRSTKDQKFFTHRPGYDHEMDSMLLLKKLAIAHLLEVNEIEILKDKGQDEEKFEIFDTLLVPVPDESLPLLRMSTHSGKSFLMEVGNPNYKREANIQYAKREKLPLALFDLSEITPEQRSPETILDQIPVLFRNKVSVHWIYRPSKNNFLATKGAIITGALLLGAVGVGSYFLSRD